MLLTSIIIIYILLFDLLNDYNFTYTSRQLLFKTVYKSARMTFLEQF